MVPRNRPPLALRRVWLALVLGWFVLTAVPHAQLWVEYLRQPPEDIRRTLIAHLDARGVRYAASRYWVAYALTFLTDERIVVKSSDFVRIREYERIVGHTPRRRSGSNAIPAPAARKSCPAYSCAGDRNSRGAGRRAPLPKSRDGREPRTANRRDLRVRAIRPRDTTRASGGSLRAARPAARSRAPVGRG